MVWGHLADCRIQAVSVVAVAVAVAGAFAAGYRSACVCQRVVVAFIDGQRGGANKLAQ